MDKQEYKILSEEIMTLIANEQFVEAVEIADRIDWRKVRSFTTLQRISDLYKINRRFDEALEILLMAYDKNPNNKNIVYSICDLYLETGDLVNALQYMAVYGKMAPGDVGNAILKYKILELEDASFEDRIEQLEKIVAMSYQEEWAYQLAYMYHRMGLATKCVETCNQLISWFGEGPFVIKSMELKMLHEKLSPSQQAVYDHRNDIADEIEAVESEEYAPVVNETEEEDFHVKTIDMSKFNTINLQKALAESMRELMGEDDQGNITHQLMEPMMDEDVYTDSIEYEDTVEELSDEPAENIDDAVYEEGYSEEEYIMEDSEEVVYEDELIYDESVPDEEYYENEEVAVEEPVYEETADMVEEESADTDVAVAFDNSENVSEESVIDSAAAVTDSDAKAIKGDTGKVKVSENEINKVKEDNNESKNVDSKTAEIFFDDKTGEIIIDEVPLGMLNNLIPGVEFVPPKNINFEKVTNKSGSSRHETKFADDLSQENDGQISLVVPENYSIEKQITGQMNLDEVMAEWEKIKNYKEIAQNEEVKQSILEKTGKIFDDYDESKKNTILAQIEEEQKARRRVIKNDIEIRKIEEIDAYESDVPEDMSVTMELNKKYNSTIWDEVDKAIAEDAKREEQNNNSNVLPQAAEVVADAVAKVADGAENVIAGAAVGIATLGAGKAATAGAETAAVVETAIAGAEALNSALSSNDNNQTVEYIEETPVEEVPAKESAEYVEEIPAEEPAEYTEEQVEYIDETLEYADEVPEESVNEEQAQMSDLNTAQINDIGSALEAAADKESAKTLGELDDSYEEAEPGERDFSPEEKEIFADFLYSKKMSAQILDAVDIISLAPYVGNVMITGDAGTGLLELSTLIMQEIQLIDNNFNINNVAKVSGQILNQKNLPDVFLQRPNGALIVEKAGKLTRDTLENLTRTLENLPEGVIVILNDTKKEMEKLIKTYPVITGYFNARIDIVPMSNNALVDYAKKYAYTKEYKIDEERGVLALHERISELQIGEHHVTTQEVENIVNDAIDYSRKPHISTFFNILAAKRYDYEDMIILREKDFGY